MKLNFSMLLFCFGVSVGCSQEIRDFVRSGSSGPSTGIVPVDVMAPHPREIRISGGATTAVGNRSMAMMSISTNNVSVQGRNVHGRVSLTKSSK